MLLPVLILAAILEAGCSLILNATPKGDAADADVPDGDDAAGDVPDAFESQPDALEEPDIRDIRQDEASDAAEELPTETVEEDASTDETGGDEYIPPDGDESDAFEAEGAEEVEVETEEAVEGADVPADEAAGEEDGEETPEVTPEATDGIGDATEEEGCPLSTCTLDSPAAGATDLGRPISFSWNPASGTGVVYELQISATSTFTSLVISEGALTTVSCELTPTKSRLLKYGGSYYWRVKATNTCGNETISSSRRFTMSKYVEVAATGNNPALVYTGSKIVVCWDNSSGIYCRLLDIDASLAGAANRVISSTDANNCSLAWTGSEVGVTYSRGAPANIYLRRLTSSGTVTGSESEVTDTTVDGASKRPSLMWGGGIFGVAWYNDVTGGFRNIYWRGVHADGTGHTAAPSQVTTATMVHSQNPTLIWDGSQFVISFDSNRDLGLEIYFAWESTTGARTDERRISNSTTEATFPSIAGSGSEYATVWQDGSSTHDIYFTRQSSTTVANVVDNSSDSTDPAVAWDGSHYGITWVDNRDGNPEIYFEEIDTASHVVTGSLKRISDTTSQSLTPSIIWAGIAFALCWKDSSKILCTLYQP